MPYKNKLDQAACAKRHYLRNKDKMKKRARTLTLKIRANNREFVDEYKKMHPCVDCGNTDIRVLDFDHVFDKKDKAIAIGSHYWAIDRLKKEIKKCEVRCANCHRIVTCERKIITERSNGIDGSLINSRQ